MKDLIMEDIKTAIAEWEDMIMLSEQNFHRRVNDEDDDSIFGLDRVLNIAKAVKYIEQKVTKKVNDTEKYLNQLGIIKNVSYILELF